MVTQTRAHQLYLALRLHFTTDTFDITKNKANIPVKDATGRKALGLDRIRTKYSTEQGVIDYFVANFVSGDRYGGLFDNGDAQYNEWRGRQERISYLFRSDVATLEFEYGMTCPADLWRSEGYHPPLLLAYLGNRVALETLVLFDKVYNFRSSLDIDLFGDPVWVDVSRLIGKYRPFVKVNRERAEKLVAQAIR